MKITFEHAKSFLCVLVVPLIIWGVKLEVNNAVMTETVQRMEDDIEKTNEPKVIVEQNRVTLAQLKERIDNANQTLKDIKDILRDRSSHDNH